MNKNDEELNIINKDAKEEKNNNLNIILQHDIELIKNALEYYDKNTQKYEDKFKNVKYISTEVSEKDTEQTVKYFYDENFKLLFKSRCEYIGIFDEKYGIWSWAWSVGFFKKNETNIIRKILLYGTELDPTSMFLKSELILSRFKITNKIQLDIHLAIVSYLSKKSIVFCQNYSTKIIDNKYIDITDNSFVVSKFYIFLLDEI